MELKLPEPFQAMIIIALIWKYNQHILLDGMDAEWSK